MARTGRRAGTSGTRDAILASARKLFAEAGYHGAGIRPIAADAGVDAALVHHYFGTKQALFAAALDVPVDPADVVAGMCAGDPGEIGQRLVRAFLGLWDSPAGQPRIRALLRSAVTDEAAARMLREFLVDAVLGPVAAAYAPDRADLRATLVGSQMLGLAVMRYIIDFEPLAGADPQTVVAAVGPTVQRYLTGPLDTAEVAAQARPTAAEEICSTTNAE